MALRHRIREVAESKGFSRMKLSRTSDTNYKTIDRLWHDPYRVIQSDILYRIAKALGVSVADLLVEEDKKELPEG